MNLQTCVWFMILDPRTILMLETEDSMRVGVIARHPTHTAVCAIYEKTAVQPAEMDTEESTSIIGAR